jgi:D-serine deaminase-like pyridoxal phosphate-dependent protein
MTDWRGPNASLIGQPGSRGLLGTPALVLDLDRLDANIRSMAMHAESRGYQLRPVAKIHKSVEIARRQVGAGAVGVGCATLSEAEAMVAGGIPGVMLFTSVVSEPKLQRLAALNARAKDLIVVIDDFGNLAQLGRVIRATGHTLQVMIDFELGGGRTGLADEDSAVALARRIHETEGLEFAGIQAYNGEGLSETDYHSRRKVVLERAHRLSELVARFNAEGLHPRIVSGGGTGSHDIDAEAGVFTELQVGSYVFMDLYYIDAIMRLNEPHPFKPALTVWGTVVSAAQPGFVVTDVGLKEIDGAFGPISPSVVNGPPSGARYSLVGDDLGRIDFANARESLGVGARFELLPPHCYQTVNLYSIYHCVAGDKLVDIWPIDALKSW